VFFSLNVQNYPPFVCVEDQYLYAKILLGFQTWSLNFCLFVNFDFSYFFVFF